MSVNRKFGPEVRRWRTKAGLTQLQVSEVLGVSQQTVAAMELRGISFDPERFRQLDALFGLRAGTAQATYVRTAEAPEEDDTELRQTIEQLTETVEELKRRLDEVEGRPKAGATPAPNRTGRPRQSPRS